MERKADGTTKPVKMGADGIAINAEGSRLYYCPLISQRLDSIPLESPIDRTMCVAADGYLYVTANQLHRQAKYQQGKDLRQKPYPLFRIRIDAEPVLLRV